MSSSSFASLICSKIQGAAGTDGGKFSSSTPAQCQSAIAAAITEYLLANVTVHITYSGMTTSSPSKKDSVTTDTMKITGSCAAMSTPGDYASWIADLQSKIAAGFTVLPPGTNAVTTTFLPFNPSSGSLSITQSNLKSAHEGNWDDPMQKTWEVVCQGIMDWINSSAGCNPAATAVPATRPGSAGTASLVKIVVV